MPGDSSFQVHEIEASIRFMQGYRYLDRCGEALVKLENVLEEGWIPGETAPKAGSLRNDQFGMTATFNSAGLTTTQIEFISFEHFLDQTCKVYDTLWQLFEIKIVNVPSIKVILQRGYKDGKLEEAAQDLLRMRLCTPHAGLIPLMGGNPDALDFVLVTTENIPWREEQVYRRCRLAGKVIRQERQPPFDERLLRRTRQLGSKQEEAIKALMKLRRQHPQVSPVAIQFDLEYAFETEFSAEVFDMPAFLEQGWKWGEALRSGIINLEGGKR